MPTVRAVVGQCASAREQTEALALDAEGDVELAAVVSGVYGGRKLAEGRVADRGITRHSLQPWRNRKPIVVARSPSCFVSRALAPLLRHTLPHQRGVPATSDGISKFRAVYEKNELTKWIGCTLAAPTSGGDRSTSEFLPWRDQSRGVAPSLRFGICLTSSIPLFTATAAWLCVWMLASRRAEGPRCD